MEFGYTLSECDVQPSRLEALERYRDCLKKWHGWLSDDEHSIWQQIHAMLWNDMVFRTINECRRLSAKNTSSIVGFNRSVAGFIDQSYVATQLLAVRRLTESQNKNSEADAITLPRLIDDMKLHIDLFTREIYVCYDGLPFDPEPARKRSLEQLMAEAEKNNGVVTGWLPTDGPDAYDSSDLAHEHFDRLAGQSGSVRSRDDRLGVDIFDKLKSKLGACYSLGRVASKFIAHAADAASRAKLTDRERVVTLSRIETSQRTICRVPAYIHESLLYIGSHGLIPTPQFDQLEHLEKGWVRDADKDRLHKYWAGRAEKIEKWTEGGWQKLLGLPG